MIGLGAIVGAVLGLLGGWLADVLPGRYAITLLVSGRPRQARYLVLAILTGAVGAGIASILAGVTNDATWHLTVLYAVNVLVAAAMLAGAAIDLEHMILPNEITFGTAILCLLSSPVRSLGVVGSIAGAVAGLAFTYLPFLLYKKLKGQSGMGLGDAKLAVAAGAWHGVEGAVFVLFAGAAQSILAAALMRVVGITYAMPASVRAEIAELRARAAAGDAEAVAALADDPMAGEEGEHGTSTLAMRLPLGPFLVLACIEMLFFRRWLSEHVFAWFSR